MEQIDRENDGDRSDDLPELMARYQAGEGVAFERLYGQLARSIRGYLRKLTPPGSEVEDLVQGTFLQLHRARHTYEPGRAVRPWVFSIARHVALMARRSAVRRVRNEVQPPDELPDLPEPTAVEPPIDRVTLERALDSLADPSREALWLHHVEGLSFREVAAVQGISESAAKLRAHRARHALRSRLVEEAS